MTDLDRRELARIAAWLLAGTAFGGATASAEPAREVDAPGGERLLRRLLGEDLERALDRARTRERLSARRAKRIVLASPGRGRIAVELERRRYRFTVWSRRSGAVTIEGDRGSVRRVVASPRGRATDADPYDTAVETDRGIVLIASSALAQRELPARLVPGARLPAIYRRLGRALLVRLESARDQRPRAKRPSR